VIRARWLVLIAVWLQAAPAQPAPGTVLELEPRGHLSAAAIDAAVGGRFRNDGETPPRATTGVDAYLLRFATTGPDGGPTETIAQLYVPREPSAPILLAFAPGSTGLVAACSPTHAWRASGQVETYGATALAYAGQGLATVLPDYLSATGATPLQPYFVATAEATVLLDALRSSLETLRTTTPAIEVAHAFAAGYSQGGHAVFAAADRASVYARELPLAGVIGFGPSGDLDTLFLNFQYTAPWVVRSYQAAYPGEVDPAEVLAEPYASRLEADVQRLCVTEAQAYYPHDPAALFTDAFLAALSAGTLGERFPVWRELFDRNDTGIQPHGLPVAIFQGVDDPVVPLSAQDAFVHRLCSLDVPVRYANYLRTRHETRYIAFRDAIDWMHAVADGAAPPDDCPEVLAR
jgi:alpha-beta hydrolase superfamily lysophospholipase